MVQFSVHGADFRHSLGVRINSTPFPLASALLYLLPVGSFKMRIVLLALAVGSAAVSAASPRIEPCAAEKKVVEDTNNAIADSTTQALELRSFLLTEKESREGRLSQNLQQAESRLFQSSQTLLQETQLLQTLVSARPRLDRLQAALPRLKAFAVLPDQASPAAAVSEVLRQQESSLDSEAVADLKTLIQIIRTLEKSSRNWRTLIGAEPPGALDELLEKVLTSHENLNEAVMNGPALLAAQKKQLSDAQNQVQGSLAARREKEAQLAELDRRLSLLRQNLPAQKAALHSCTRRAHFGE